MEYDCFQDYFFHDFDTEEDFHTSTAPSEDIWKKFELLPTPPMSPTRSSLHLWPGEKPASWRAKLPAQDEDCEIFSAGNGKMLGNLSSIIIRDCMWSSFSAIKQPEKVRASAASPAPVRASRGQCVPPGAPLVAAAADCVDPAAVLTYPANNSCRKPASSGSESRSDSSDDDEDDEDEEEIDVVTVESKQNRMRVMNVRQPVTLRVRADPCPKRFHMSVHRQQHNYAARSPDSDPEDEDDDEEEDDDDEEEEEELQIKRVCSRSSSSSPASRGSRPASPSSSPQTSDAEDTDRRRNHNFLERKRRNDLKSRFLALRDQVPGLQSSKAPKVAILTHATEYLARLHTKEKRQLQERKRLLMRKQQLLRRLAELKRS
ncbi:protein L-Myc-1b-like [Synchiropus splendidus]|uniref:protein L-Myc-1b-like n=1 Tax=Synchiropus splendidus TaxID=270530 RepID=UPI00237E1324|nr:protein L-Myc-1b-like [Synchiropus splendidus]